MSDNNFLICPKCGNNRCLIDPEIYAARHMTGPRYAWYWLTRNKLKQYIRLRQLTYRHSLMDKS